MTPTTAAEMAVSGAVMRTLSRVDSTSGPPARMKMNEGRKVNKVATAAPATPAASCADGPNSRVGPAADEADKGDNHDQRAGSGFAERQAVDHLAGGQPVVVFDAALVDVGQHGIGAAEGHQRGLGEEPAHLRERAGGAEAGGQQQPGAGADDAADQCTRMRRGQVKWRGREWACRRRSARGRRSVCPGACRRPGTRPATSARRPGRSRRRRGRSAGREAEDGNARKAATAMRPAPGSSECGCRCARRRRARWRSPRA